MHAASSKLDRMCGHLDCQSANSRRRHQSNLGQWTSKSQLWYHGICTSGQNPIDCEAAKSYRANQYAALADFGTSLMAHIVVHQLWCAISYRRVGVRLAGSKTRVTGGSQSLPCAAFHILSGALNRPTGAADWLLTPPYTRHQYLETKACTMHI